MKPFGDLLKVCARLHGGMPFIFRVKIFLIAEIFFVVIVTKLGEVIVTTKTAIVQA